MPVFNGISPRFVSQPEVLALTVKLAWKLAVTLNRDNIKKLVLDDYRESLEISQQN